MEKIFKKKKKMRNTVGVRLLNNKQSYLKQTSKPSFVTKKIFGNNFVAIHEIKNILMFNELVYVWMCIFQKSTNVWILLRLYQKQIWCNQSRLLFIDTGSLGYEIETGNFFEKFSKNREVFPFKSHSAKSKYYYNSNALVVVKMKDEMGNIAIGKVVGLKPSINSILVSDSVDCKRAKSVSKNAITIKIHNKFRDNFLNKIFLRNPMNRIQSVI